MAQRRKRQPGKSQRRDKRRASAKAQTAGVWWEWLEWLVHILAPMIKTLFIVQGQTLQPTQPRSRLAAWFEHWCR